MDEDQLKSAEETQNMEVNTDYMKEQIKQRPINRRRLLRRTLTTGFLAVLFGAVACFVFLFLEPYFSNMLNPVPPAEPITFPEETAFEEMSPEEMLADDEQIVTEAENAAAEAAAEATAAKLEAQIREQLEAQALSSQIDPADLERQVREVMQQQTDNIETYEKTYETLGLLARDLSTAMVSVSSVTSDTDWFNDPYENRGTTSGLIIAETETELLILSKDSSLRDAESIQITLSDGSSYPSEIRQMDVQSGLQILTLHKEDLPETEENPAYSVAELGSSISPDLVGSPIIVIGAPAGTVGGLNFGMITGSSLTNLPSDAVYKVLSTDIYGSVAATGVVFNLRGKVIGVIDMEYRSSATPNLLCALGITELKPLIEKLSNAQLPAYLGVHGSDVTEEISEESGLPIGAYITSIDMDSPAMEAGIQSGDVITQLGEDEITGYTDLIEALGRAEPDQEITVLLVRSGPEEQAQMELTVTVKQAME